MNEMIEGTVKALKDVMRDYNSAVEGKEHEEILNKEFRVMMLVSLAKNITSTAKMLGYQAPELENLIDKIKKLL